MSELEKYNHAFYVSLHVDEKALASLEYQAIQEWDSVGHMTLMAAIEESFGIVFEMDDILDFSSYEKGKIILAKYGVILS